MLALRSRLLSPSLIAPLLLRSWFDFASTQLDLLVGVLICLRFCMRGCSWREGHVVLSASRSLVPIRCVSPFSTKGPSMKSSLLRASAWRRKSKDAQTQGKEAKNEEADEDEDLEMEEVEEEEDEAEEQSNRPSLAPTSATPRSFAAFSSSSPSSTSSLSSSSSSSSTHIVGRTHIIRIEENEHRMESKRNNNENEDADEEEEEDIEGEEEEEDGEAEEVQSASRHEEKGEKGEQQRRREARLKRMAKGARRKEAEKVCVCILLFCFLLPRCQFSFFSGFICVSVFSVRCFFILFLFCFVFDFSTM